MFQKKLEILIFITIYLIIILQGGSLHSLITRAKSYDEVLNYIEVLDWLVQLVLALNHLHKQ